MNATARPPTPSPARSKTISKPSTGSTPGGPPRVHQRDRPPARAFRPVRERHGQAAVRARPARAPALQGRSAHRRRPPRGAAHGAPAPADRGLPGRVPRLLAGTRCTRRPSGWSTPCPIRWSSGWPPRWATRASIPMATRSPTADGAIEELAYTPLADLAVGDTVGDPSRRRERRRSGSATSPRSGSCPARWSRCSIGSRSAARSPSRRAARSRSSARRWRRCSSAPSEAADERRIDTAGRESRRLALSAHHAEPARVAPHDPGPARRLVLAQGARLRRPGLHGRGRLHGPGQLGHRPRRRRALRLHAAQRHPALQPDGDPAPGARRSSSASSPGATWRRPAATTTRARSASCSGCCARSPSPPATWPR